MLTLATACYKRYDLLAELIASAEAGTRKPDRYFFVDNGGKIDTVDLPPNTTVYRPGKNVGVAAAVNIVFRENEDFTVWTNDDVRLNPDTLEVMEVAALEDESRLFILPTHGAGSAFTLFLARKRMFEEVVGWFDERFYPAYFEDNDFAYRMGLVGIEKYHVETEYFHHTSGTIAVYSTREKLKHDAQFRANEHRYFLKWGGPPGEETWEEPRS